MADIDVGAEDCASKSAPTPISVSSRKKEAYYFDSSSQAVRDELTEEATKDCWGQIGSKLTIPTCTRPCKGFAILTNVKIGFKSDSWTRWWSGFTIFMAHNVIEVTLTISGDIVTGCSSN